MKPKLNWILVLISFSLVANMNCRSSALSDEGATIGEEPAGRGSSGSAPVRTGGMTGDGGAPAIGLGGSTVAGGSGSAPVPTGGMTGDGGAPAIGLGGSTVAGSSGGQAQDSCRCTRRPGAGNSPQCPVGVGASVSQDVGPAGATLTLSGTPSTVGVPVELQIPPNALSQTITIRITETTDPPPESIADWSPLYHFQPEDLVFALPAVVRMPWSSTDGLVPKSLSIYWSKNLATDALTPLADNYVNAGFNQGSVRNLGWAIVGVPRDASSTCP